MMLLVTATNATPDSGDDDVVTLQGNQGPPATDISALGSDCIRLIFQSFPSSILLELRALPSVRAVFAEREPVRKKLLDAAVLDSMQVVDKVQYFFDSTAPDTPMSWLRIDLTAHEAMDLANRIEAVPDSADTNSYC